MSWKELLKLKRELDILELKVEISGLQFELRFREALGKPLVSNEGHEVEKVEEGPEEEELLVSQRALCGLTCQEELDQRESIFRTRCTVGGKVCSLIINEGSCTNVASQSMVDKLKLPVTPHPKPYTIPWPNQRQGLQVSTRCLVSLSIGKTYEDEIWCDVLPMDACHVLLGRPWLFDRAVMHDGHKNTYTLTHGHKRITLLPLQSTLSSKPKDSPQMDLPLTTLPNPQVQESEPHKDWDLLGQESFIPSSPLLPHVSPHVFPLASIHDQPPHTTTHSYPVSSILDQTGLLGGSRGTTLASKVDFGNKYSQNRVFERGRKKTTFEPEGDMYEWLVMTFWVDTPIPGEYGVSATLNCEENKAILSLRANSNPPGEYDGDHPTKPHVILSKEPPPSQESKNVNKVAALARNHIYNAWANSPGSYRFWPDFVTVVEHDSELRISCTHDHLKAQDLSFPTSTYGPHLELVWSVNQAKNRAPVLLRANTATSDCKG